MVTACSQTWQQNIDQWDLSAGTSQAIDLVTACSWPSAVVYASVTGQCAVIETPYAATDRNLANLAEFTIPGSGNQDFYDLSSVVSISSLCERPDDGVGSSKFLFIFVEFSDISAPKFASAVRFDCSHLLFHQC